MMLHVHLSRGESMAPATALHSIFLPLVCLHSCLLRASPDVQVPDFDGWHGWTVAAPSAPFCLAACSAQPDVMDLSDFAHGP